MELIEDSLLQVTTNRANTNSNSLLPYNVLVSSSTGSTPTQGQLLLDRGGLLHFDVDSAVHSDQVTNDSAISVFTNLSIDASDPHQTIIPIIPTMVTTTIGFLPLGLGLMFVCTLGLMGNILSAVVLARPKMKSTYSILTLGLTLCDTIYLLTKLLRYGLLSLFVHFSIAHSYTEVWYPILGPRLRALTFTAHTGSTYCTVALAIDRYISVCWPVEARFLCTKRRAHVLVIMVFLLSIFYNLPRWIEFHTEVSVAYDGTLDSNITMYSMKISSLRKNPSYKTFYIFWGYFIVMFFLPFTLLTFFNFAIFQKVRESNRAREKLTSFQKREISFAMMLLSIVAVFLTCSLDYLVLDLLTYFKQPYPPFWDELGSFLLTLNSALNFIIYCAFGRKFRHEFYQLTRELFWRRKKVKLPKTISSRIVTNSNSGYDCRVDTFSVRNNATSHKMCQCVGL